MRPSPPFSVPRLRSRFFSKRAFVSIATLTILTHCTPPSHPDAGDVVVAETMPSDVNADAPARCANDSECNDSTFCNGVERCMPGAPNADPRGCVPAASPACGASPCDEAMQRCDPTCSAPDGDGDGHRAQACGGDDCDDHDPNRFPGNPEICDAADHDEDCDGSTYGARDLDQDHHDDARCCNIAAGARHCGDDCDDVRRSVHPDASEVCNGYDDNCDGNVDEGVTVEGWADMDHDLHGNPMHPLTACTGSPNFATNDDDCDDTTPLVHGAQLEICDGRDNNCNGVIDDGTQSVTWYGDNDHDGFGSAASGTVVACAPPSGYSLLPTDCDDTAASINPGAAEACDGVDNNCNGMSDFRIASSDFEDDDGDHQADAHCPAGGPDCDDRDPLTLPSASEICDGRDNNCNGTVDEGAAPIAWYSDADGDLYGDSAASVMSCAPVAGRITVAGDCDDHDPLRHPGIRDACDGVDNDCDTMTDEDGVVQAYYIDADGDGFGSGSAMLGCRAPATGTWVPRGGDCADSRADVHPGASEVCANGVDEDCDGIADDCGGDAGVTDGGATDGGVDSGCATGRTRCGSGGTASCVDLATDVAHCGSCGVTCSAPMFGVAVCSSGICDFTCPGFQRCGAACVDPLSTTSCGPSCTVCSVPANGTATCDGSACGIACNAGYHACGSNCADDRSITSCGTSCAPCTAPANATATCDGTTCGFNCNAGFVLVAGSCTPAAPRLIAPLSTSIVTDQRPRMRWQLAPMTTGAHIEIYRDRAATMLAASFDVSGSNGAPTASLSPGTYFWRAFGRVGSTIGTQASIAVWEFVVPARSGSVATSWGHVADFNGDGRPDVAVSSLTSGNPGVLVFMNSASGISPSPTRGYTEPPCFGCSGDGFGSTIANGDFDGDGYSDLFVSCTSSAHLYWYRGSATGLPSVPTSMLPSETLRIAFAGDINRDGYGDVVYYTNNMFWSVNIRFGAPGGLSASRLYRVPSSFAPNAAVPAGDVDGDGFADVLTHDLGASGDILLLRGSPTDMTAADFVALPHPFSYGNLGEGSLAGIGDVNGDGYSDFAFSGFWSGHDTREFVFHGGPSAPSSEATSFVLMEYDSFLAAGDVNGDGYSDVAITMTSGACPPSTGCTSRVVLGSSSGLSSTSTALVAPSTPAFGPGGASAGDIDGDGYADVLIRDASNPLIYIYRGGAGGIIATSPTQLTPPTGTAGFGTVVAGLL